MPGLNYVWQKYPHVVRLGHRTTEGWFQPGDDIIVQEKLDGANASFLRDGDTIRCYSRNIELSDTSTLRGFHGWVHEHINVDDLLPGYVYYGEWLTRHKLDYGDNADKFYLFDVWDVGTNTWLDDRRRYGEATRLDVTLVPTLYVGPYVDEEHLVQFVGQSKLASHGEGIVVKHWTPKQDEQGNLVHVKLVTPEFSEARGVKKIRDPNVGATEREFVETYVTPTRIHKAVERVAETDGTFLLPLHADDLGVAIPLVTTAVYEDALDEEGESLSGAYDDKLLRKQVGRIVAPILRQMAV